MHEITRIQFAAAAVVVVLLGWLGARALNERGPAGAGAGAAPVAPIAAGSGRGAPVDAATPAAGGVAEAGTSGGAVTVERAAAAPIVVHVAGAVRRPGVYRLKDGDRVADAVARAGGSTRRADLDAINLAAKAKDGVQILVPRRVPAGAAAGAGGASGGPVTAGGATAAGSEATTAGGTAAPGAAAAIIDLNTATEAQLETLDGVGPATAAKILQYRQANGPFRSVDDLEQVPGIGPKKLAAIRPGVRV